jgi:hypothetical protein
LAFDLKKLLEGAVAQVNPFDGGKNFASVQAAPPRPASTARPKSLFSRDIPGLGVSTNDVVAQLPGATKKVAKGAGQVGDALLGSPKHLADQITYAVNAQTYQRMRDRGEINDEVLGQLLNQEGEKAGFKASDQGGTVLRKTAAAVAMPTATILTAGAAAPAFAGLKGAPLLGKVAGGAAMGAGYGAGFGGLATAGQYNDPTLEDYAMGIGGGGRRRCGVRWGYAYRR